MLRSNLEPAIIATRNWAHNLDRQIAADNNVMHAKPDLRVLLKWMIARSGSVITDVMSLDANGSTF